MTSKKLIITVLAGIFVLGTCLLAFAEEAEKEYTYMGVKNCKMCHNKAATGKQFEVWSESTHAKAFEVLASEESVAKAKEMGLGNPQEEEACLKCHVTAFPVMGDLENQKITMEEGVSCESCHGPGSGYKSKKTMAAITAGEIEGTTVGLITPSKEVCVTCHKAEGNPFHKEFKFEEAVKKIAHPIVDKSE